MCLLCSKTTQLHILHILQDPLNTHVCCVAKPLIYTCLLCGKTPQLQMLGVWQNPLVTDVCCVEKPLS